MSAETTGPAHEHSFPRNPPGGSPLYPSPCECGVTHGQDTAQRRLATAVAAMRHAYGDGWAAAVPEDVRGELARRVVHAPGVPDLVAVGNGPLLDPDCRDGKHVSCTGPPCECPVPGVHSARHEHERSQP